jgi:hypothetical protein
MKDVGLGPSFYIQHPSSSIQAAFFSSLLTRPANRNQGVCRT